MDYLPRQVSRGATARSVNTMLSSHLRENTRNPNPSRGQKGVVLPFPTRRSTPDSLPIVDIDRLYDRNPSIQRSAAQRIGEIAMENGFLYIRNHNISKALIDAVYEQASYFFSSELIEKNRYYIGNTVNHRGYVPVTEKGNYADEHGPRLYEAFDMGIDLPADDPDYIRGNPLLGPNVWPDQPGFKYILTRYFNEVNQIAQTMCQAFELVLDLPRGFFRNHMRKPVSQLRLLHYLKNTQVPADDNVHMGAHTDYECFTILNSRTPNLQVLDKTSTWINAPPIDNTFYFNIGDMLEAWSGGLLVATPHRVYNTGDERFSIPFFAATDYETVVAPVDCPRYRNKQKHYEPIVAGEHLISQLLRDFPYLRARYENGLLNLSDIHPGPNPFENRILESV